MHFLPIQEDAAHSRTPDCVLFWLGNQALAAGNGIGLNHKIREIRKVLSHSPTGSYLPGKYMREWGSKLLYRANRRGPITETWKAVRARCYCERRRRSREPQADVFCAGLAAVRRAAFLMGHASRVRYGIVRCGPHGCSGAGISYALTDPGVTDPRVADPRVTDPTS